MDMVTVQPESPNEFQPRLNAISIAVALLFTFFVSVAKAQTTGEAPVLSPSVNTQTAEDLEKRKKTGTLLPGVRASTTYSSNYNLDPRGVDSTSGDFIVLIAPYLRGESETPRLRYKLDLGLNNLYRVRSGEKIIGRVNLNSKFTAALAGDYLWLDGSGIVANTNRDLFGKLNADPDIAFTNTAQVRQFALSPYLKTRLGGFADSTLRYGLQYNVNSASVVEQSKLIQTVSADIRGSDSESRSWNWSWGGEYSIRKYGQQDISRRFSIGSAYWVPTPSVRLTGSAVYDQIDGVKSRDGKVRGFGPGIGIDVSLAERTRADLKVIRRYYGTSNNFSFSHSSQLVYASANYSKGITGSVDSGIFSIDPGSVFGNYAVVNNPVYRSFLAENLRLGYGVPYGAGLINDTYILQKKGGASIGLVGLRSSLTANVYRDARDTTIFVTVLPSGLSGPRGGSVGSLSGNFNGVITLTSASLDYRYRFDARSALVASYSLDKSQASTANLGSQTGSIKAGISTKLSPDLEIGGGVRYTKGKVVGDTPSEFDDKAIFGTVDLRF
jgi:uncharacterized protein (PEP-CTERM system associated)